MRGHDIIGWFQNIDRSLELHNPLTGKTITRLTVEQHEDGTPFVQYHEDDNRPVGEEKAPETDPTGSDPEEPTSDTPEEGGSTSDPATDSPSTTS
jgi:hypothetical protein